MNKCQATHFKIGVSKKKSLSNFHSRKISASMNWIIKNVVSTPNKSPPPTKKKEEELLLLWGRHKILMIQFEETKILNKRKL